MYYLAQLINILTQLIYLLVIVYVLLSYIMSPYHPVRRTVDSIVNPILAPIRRMLPQTGMIDFSPLVLIAAVWIINRLLLSILF